jgi:hypothetical protein
VLNGSYDESRAAVAEPEPVSEQMRPAETAEAPTAPTPSAEAPGAPVEEPSAEREPPTKAALFADDDLGDLRAQWAGVQAGFVDDPKVCVQKADDLVSQLVEKLTTGFAVTLARLEQQWARGKEASTEDLRLTLMHYREFFDRLLTV